jgi:2-(1,2-epoxy-1,2-dihydrophenyl)acetyl-CoA isomerase
MSFEYVKYEKDGPIATITLNRPAKLNALLHQTIREVHAALDDAAEDDSVRSLILRGEGRAFCSGDDMLGMVDTKRTLPMQGKEDLRPEGYHSLVIALREIRKPVVASVRGYALGAGLELAIACDFVVAEEDATFGMVLIARGMVGGTYLLPMMVGMRRATELILLGETFDARKALELGLINRIVPADRLEEETRRLAGRLAQAPTAAVGLAKTAINRGTTMRLREGMEYQGLVLALTLLTEDFKEGVLAFSERREPKFLGK